MGEGSRSAPRRANRLLLATAIAGLSLVGFAEASADPLEPTTQPATTQPSPTSSATDAQEQPFTLRPVIVTAEKIPQRQEDVPASLTVLSRDALHDADITDIREAALRAPNVFISQFANQRLNFPFVRGIGAGQSSPAVTTYIDGVPQLSYATSNIQFADIDRIEFLRGPQGTLYGRNTLGGVLNVYSNQPTNNLEYDGDVTEGNYNLQDYRGGVRFAVVPDKVFVAISGGYVQRDGYSRNIFNGQPVDNRADYFGRFELRLTPTDRWDIRLTVNGERDQDGDYPLEDLATLHAHPFEVDHNFQGNSRRNVGQAAITATYHGDDIDLTSVSAAQGWTDRDLTDLDYTPLDLARRQSAERQNNYIEEFRAGSPSGRAVVIDRDLKFRWLSGILFFATNDQQNSFDQFHAGLASMTFPAPFTQFNNANENDAGIGAFGQGTLTLWDKLDLTAGLRFDYEHAESSLRGFAYSPFIPGSSDAGSRNFDRVSPHLEAGYHWAPDLLTYASISEGYKAGGFNASPPPGKLAFGQETSWSYEAGVRTSMLDHRLFLSADAFYIEWKHMQLDVPNLTSNGGPGVFYTDNVGSSQSTGVEAELRAHVTDSLDIFSGIGTAATEFRHYTLPGGGSAHGNSLPNAPDFTANLGAQYTLRLGSGMRGYARGEVFGVGRYFYDPTNAREQSAYFLSDFRLGVAGKNWRLEGFIDNAFNTHYFPVALPYPNFAASGYVGESGVPRTYGVLLGVDF